MWLALWLASAQAADACTYVGFADVTAPAAPAVIVLGERHGFQPDLSRASKVVHGLAERAPVRVALEAVHRKYQGVLDAFDHGQVDASDLPSKLEWKDSWGFAFRPYAPLIEAGHDLDRVTVIGAGVDLGPKPDDVEVSLPPRYIDLLRPGMGEHPVPIEQEGTFLQAMAWRDYAIASAALKDWDGTGYVVIVTGRGHVEGGKGVAWQAARLTQAPVESFVLKPGKEPPCNPGDKLWR
jgi:hypothetical protein